jgi:hypothetical protein
MARPKVFGDVKRMMVSLPLELAGAVDDYRFANRLKNDAETLRRLIEAGLKAEQVAAVPPGGDPGRSRKNAGRKRITS